MRVAIAGNLGCEHNILNVFLWGHSYFQRGLQKTYLNFFSATSQRIRCRGQDMVSLLHVWGFKTRDTFSWLRVILTPPQLVL